jgi:hypothetical protein
MNPEHNNALDHVPFAERVRALEGVLATLTNSNGQPATHRLSLLVNDADTLPLLLEMQDHTGASAEDVADAITYWEPDSGGSLLEFLYGLADENETVTTIHIPDL